MGVGLHPQDDRLATRLAWVTGLRLGLLVFLLASTAFFYLRGDLTHYPQSRAIALVTIASAFALAGVYATLLRARKHLTRLAEAQLVLDQITWTAIVYVSGGATSGATSFYALTCLVGAILIGQRGAALAALTGIALFTVLCGGFVLGWVHAPPDQAATNYAATLEAVVYPLLLNGLGIVVVALLGGYLAERLRVTGGELALATQRALAAERLATLGRVAAGLAHEIRNPLGSIAGSVQLLREAPGLGEDDRRLCEIIETETTRLANLVSDMMDLARPRKPEPTSVDLGRLARDVVELASRSDRSAGDVTVTYEGPAEPVLVRCDGAQIKQVIWNLVRNAVQASGAGKSVTVAIATEGSDRIALRVVDEGPGIPRDQLDHIFEAFFTTRSQGAGIGLAVVRRIVDEHAALGASLRVQNAPSKGACFEVILARAAQATKNAPGTVDAPTASTRPLGG